MSIEKQRSAVQCIGAQPTMVDVAALAGVSAMTVSRVLNSDPRVRDNTRNKVQAAVQSLGYVPNQSARRLAGAIPMRIGVLYSNPSAGYLSELLVGLLGQSSLSNVQLVVEQCEEQRWRGKAERLCDGGIDGVILPPPLCDAVDLVDLLVQQGVAVATLAHGVPDSRVSALRIDDYLAAHAMTCHLADLGHTCIGFIVGHSNQSASAQRHAGFKAAMAERGLPVPEQLIAQGMFTYRSGLDAAEQLLEQEPRPTAIFASNDDMAAAAVAVAHRMGLDVPGDLTVVGFDDTALASTIWPALTTVRQPIAEMAAQAVESLVRQIVARREGASPAPEHTVMQHVLVRRQSDAAPRRRPLVREV